MFSFDEVRIGKIVVHNVGNRANQEGVRHSRQVLEIDEMLRDLLKRYFLSAFKIPQYFKFTDESSLDQNPVWGYIHEVFTDETKFFENSRHLANLLYEFSDHPKIKGGEFYMAYFRDCQIQGELTNAIGLFKSENKETFLKVYPRGDIFELAQERGININKLDKGCLIFNTEADDGYRVLTVDNLGKGQNAQYWNGQFLRTAPVEDNYFQTQNYLRLTKNFVDEVYNSANEVERADQIDLLNRSVQYFKENDHFERENFEKNVMLDEPVVEAFNDFKNHYQAVNQMQIDDRFPISDEAVRREKGRLRSILKLDKNFHVYIHGQRDRVERGYDEARGMHFYKLFFHDEA